MTEGKVKKSEEKEVEETKEELVEEVKKEVVEKPKIVETPISTKEKVTLTNKMKENPWVFATLVLGILSLILITGNFPGGVTGNVISGEQVSAEVAGNSVLELANSQVPGVELIAINEKSGLYEVILLMEGREIPVYVTLDGENLISEVTPIALILQQMEQQPATQQTPPQTESTFSEEDLVKIKTFSTCLADNGLKIYGAGWCGYCQRLINYFGGEEAIAPIFIECSDAQRNPTENAELCEKEGITGFPTVKINGDVYLGDRTFEAFAEATTCSAPEVSTF